MTQMVDHRRVLVAVGSGANDEVVVAGRHLELIERRSAPCPAGHGVDDRRVFFVHQRHAGFYLGLGKRVVDLARKLYLSFLFLRFSLGRGGATAKDTDKKEGDDSKHGRKGTTFSSDVQTRGVTIN